MPAAALAREGATARLRDDVHALADDIGERNVFRPAALRAAADLIERRWTTQGYEVVRGHWADAPGWPNLEIRRIGGTHPAQSVVIGAHYDSVPGSPGANDNASGVAALLELSRRMATGALRRTVRFVAFANEEPPFFGTREMGSAAYAHAARTRGDDIRLMVSLETLGYYRDEPGSQTYPPFLKWWYPDRANFVAFVSNVRSRRALRRAVDAFRAHSSVPAQALAVSPWILPHVALSDHWSFWREGYRALMVTDTAFLRDPCYHTADDRPHRLDYPRLAAVTDGLVAVVAEVADDAR